jgi:nuclear pore complex protein Nup133
MIGLFERDSGVKPISPENVLGAYTEELNHRFTGLDVSIQESIKKDMQAEDEALSRYIETCQLEKWYQAALDLAKRDIMEEVHEETEDGEKMQRVAANLVEIESQINQNERDKAESLLHSKLRYKPKSKLDRSLSHFRASNRF